MDSEKVVRAEDIRLFRTQARVGCESDLSPEDGLKWENPVKVISEDNRLLGFGSVTCQRWFGSEDHLILDLECNLVFSLHSPERLDLETKSRPLFLTASGTRQGVWFEVESLVVTSKAPRYNPVPIGEGF